MKNYHLPKCVLRHILLVVALALLPMGLKAATPADKLVNVNHKTAAVETVFDDISKQSGLNFFYSSEMAKEWPKITIRATKKPAEEVIRQVAELIGCSYKITGNIVTVSPMERSGRERTVKGVVRDENGEVLVGVPITIGNGRVLSVTDESGSFKIKIPIEQTTLKFSYVGLDTEYIQIGPGNTDVTRNVTLRSDNKLNEVVVTGIYERKKESFTGSAQTYNNEELKMAGNMNLIQSLKTLDPSFAIIENNDFGSDPNKLPDLEINGKSSIVGLKEQYGEDPNQPLFILDGFETTLQTIMDLSLDRIGSVTILKDAASTAIYGSKAANGVIVVETKAPTMGKLRVSYDGSFDVSFADLSDYNLMNASEKLSFEKLAGNFKSNIADYQELREMRYNALLADVRRGVDTYWLSEPLRTGLNQRHNLYTQGGNNQFRYGIGLTYNNIKGVMKSSNRDVINGNVDIFYRVGKLTLSNKLTVNVNSMDNPVVEFSEYAKANPYYRKRNADGSVSKWLEYPDANLGYASVITPVGNPLYNDALNSYNKGNSFGVREVLNLEYRPFSFLYLRVRGGINKSTSETEVFTSPDDTSFDQTELLKKGSYDNNRTDYTAYDGDFTITYGQMLAEKHQINAVLGTSVQEINTIAKSFSCIGFPEGNFTTPAFANSFSDNVNPGYHDAKSRSTSFFFNGSYSYLNRYLVDANFRYDGSSVFGTNKKFTETWAFGVAWNIHNEKFIKDHTDIFNMLKLRASVGNPGNQNFGSFNTITTYMFNNWLQNNFGAGLIIDAFGNPDLDWQKTINYNIGMDVSLWNRLHFNFDYYLKNTDPLLAQIGIPLSVGTSSKLTNIGSQTTKGLNGTLKYAITYRPKERINWTASLSFRHLKTYYDKIGSKLDQYNNENISKNLTRYYDGGSPTALWAERSAGIDPATGKEIFVTKDGKNQFYYNYAEEVEVGDTRPTLEGVFGNTFFWKGFSCSVYMRYSFGAEAFNSTVYQKVENISYSGISYNQDKRALYDRWKNPGDMAKFKGISLSETTPMSSRFVQDNDYLTLESVRLSYEFPEKWMWRIGFSGMTLSAYMNDIARWSTMKEERGISYPFARSVSFALSFNF